MNGIETQTRLYSLCHDALPTFNLHQLLGLALKILDQIYEQPVTLEVEPSILTIKVRDIHGSRLGYMQMERRGFPKWYPRQPDLLGEILSSPDRPRGGCVHDCG
jgi:hypothetical protein